MKALANSNLNLVLIPLFALIFCLTLAMQIGSSAGSHPDELKHIAAAKYYVENWLPPRIGQEGLTRSAYGTTYLEDFDIVYLFYGKFQKLISVFNVSSPLSFRLFNLTLLSMMLIATYRSKLKLSLLLFFITPQVWYLFSYVSGEAFPLFLSFFSIVFLSRVSQTASHSLKNAILLGLTIALLILSKPSFYIFLAIAFAFLTVFYFNEARATRRELIKTALVCCTIVASICGTRLAVDIWLNGLSRFERLDESVEKYARHEFKNSTPLKETYYGKALEEKGVPLLELFTKWDWHKTSYKSSTGYYGQLEFPSDKSYYLTISALYCLLLICIIVLSADENRRLASKLGMIAALGVASTCTLSLARSWSYDFQAQGRYLLAIIPITALYVTNFSSLSESKTLKATSICCIICSLYSFAVFGLGNLSE